MSRSFTFVAACCALAVAALCALVLLAAPAGAAVITVGPPLDGGTPTHHAVCEHKGKKTEYSQCMFSQDVPSFATNVPGKVVGWSVQGATGAISLQLLHGNTGRLSSATETGTGGDQTFPTSLPIAVGDRFAIVLGGKGGETNEVGRRLAAGATYSGWLTPPQYEQTLAPSEAGIEGRLLVNIQVRPAPTVTGVSPASAQQLTTPTVTVTGTDFAEVSEVSFGSDFEVPFEVVSETELIAHPTVPYVGVVPVRVTAAGGQGELENAFTSEAEQFTFPTIPTDPGQPGTSVDIPPLAPVVVPPLTFPKEKPECRVPKLKGKTLKQAKPLLAAAHCKLGAVAKRKGPKARRGKVIGELPPAGAPARGGYPVKLTLGR
jgi:hypothetical protein